VKCASRRNSFGLVGEDLRGGETAQSIREGRKKIGHGGYVLEEQTQGSDRATNQTGKLSWKLWGNIEN